MVAIKKDDLLFLPLGGSNEIGMNANLYHYKGKWILIDFGVAFADDYYPGVDLLVPDISFLEERKDDLLAIIFTHAHEDHVGAVGFLWDKLRCPIYATPFTAGLVRHKLAETGLGKMAKINEINAGSRFKVGAFDLEMVHITHSIPEMNAVYIRTEHGNIFHTGDWKFDTDPVIGPVSDEKKLKALGDEGVLAMVCDSTNVFYPKFSGSEGGLKERLSEIISQSEGMVVVTAFASNVARMETIARAAQENGRKVFLSGKTFNRIDTIARESGYLKDIEPFLTEREINDYPRDKVLVMCTGSQGQHNAAMAKMAFNIHSSVRLRPGDTAIFSSKVIPGNDKAIFKMYNALVKMEVNLFTESDNAIHVSGHPSREELKRMYELINPKIAIPTHGEALHLNEHSKLAREIGIKHVLEIQNGEMVKLAPNDAESVGIVNSGYLAVDGINLYHGDGDVMKRRRRLQSDGIIFVSLSISRKGKLAAEPIISTNGVISSEREKELLGKLSEELTYLIAEQRNASDDSIYKTVRHLLRRTFKQETGGKKPPIEIHLHRV